MDNSCRSCLRFVIRFGANGRPYDYNDRTPVCVLTGNEVNPDTDRCDKYEPYKQEGMHNG